MRFFICFYLYDWIRRSRVWEKQWWNCTWKGIKLAFNKAISFSWGLIQNCSQPKLLFQLSLTKHLCINLYMKSKDKLRNRNYNCNWIDTAGDMKGYLSPTSPNIVIGKTKILSLRGRVALYCFMLWKIPVSSFNCHTKKLFHSYAVKSYQTHNLNIRNTFQKTLNYSKVRA